MSENIVSFSRLLRIFELYDKPAFIIELDHNGKKTLYISFSISEHSQYFESYEDTILKSEFESLSEYCLMSECVDASYMFYESQITHFEVDCPNLKNGQAMFLGSPIKTITAQFPVLENARSMFFLSGIEEIHIDFPSLKSVKGMFTHSKLRKISSNFPVVTNADFMFSHTNLEKATCKFPKLKNFNLVFQDTPSEFKVNHPHFFL